nr:type II toxin-antitoxin system CcdA family antitoxin [Citrobacter sp. On28M]
MSTRPSTPVSYGESASMTLTKNVEQEKNDMEAINQFMEKAGLLTDDEFFGSL